MSEPSLAFSRRKPLESGLRCAWNGETIGLETLLRTSRRAKKTSKLRAREGPRHGARNGLDHLQVIEGRLRGLLLLREIVPPVRRQVRVVLRAPPAERVFGVVRNVLMRLFKGSS